MVFAIVYAVVGRLLSLLVVRGRGEASKDVELVLLRHEISVLRRQLPRPRLAPADRLIMAAFARHLPASLRKPVNVAALAPRTPGPQMDLPAQGGDVGSTNDPKGGSRAGGAARAGQPDVGSPADPRRDGHPRLHGVGLDGVEHRDGRWHGSGAATLRADVAAVL